MSRAYRETDSLLHPQLGQAAQKASLPWRVLKSIPEVATTALTLEALIQRFAVTVVHSLQQDGVSISMELRQKLSFGVPGVAALLTLAAHGYNYRHRLAKIHPAGQDRAAALFSSSFFFIIHDAFSTVKSALPLGWVITLCLAMPASIFFLRTVTPLTADQSVRHIDFTAARIPEQQRSTLENVWNAFGGALLGAAPALVFSVIERELQCVSASLSSPAMALSALVAAAGVVSGYNLTEYPKQYAYFVTIMEVFAKAALSYTAVSGILSMIIGTILSEGCKDMSTEERAGFSVLCAAFALMASVYTGLHTQVRFWEKHLGFIKTCENVKWVAGGLKRAASAVVCCPCRVWGALFGSAVSDSDSESYKDMSPFDIGQGNGDFEVVELEDRLYAASGRPEDFPTDSNSF